MKLSSREIQSHTLHNGLIIDIVACYEGETLQFYDLYDQKTGECLNTGFPWYGKEPNKTELEEMFCNH